MVFATFNYFFITLLCVSISKRDTQVYIPRSTRNNNHQQHIYWATKQVVRFTYWRSHYLRPGAGQALNGYWLRNKHLLGARNVMSLASSCQSVSRSVSVLRNSNRQTADRTAVSQAILALGDHLYTVSLVFILVVLIHIVVVVVFDIMRVLYAHGDWLV